MKTIREIIITGEKLNKLFAALELLDEISGDFDSEDEKLNDDYENELMKMTAKIWEIYFFNTYKLKRNAQNYLKNEAEARRKTFNASKVQSIQ